MEIKSYYILCNGNQYGPFTCDTLKSYIEDGYFLETDYVWDDDKNEWRTASKFSELLESFARQKSGASSKTGESAKLNIPDNLILKGTKIYYHNYRTGELQERAYKRLNIEIPAEIKISETENFVHVKVSNISAGGMGIELTGDLNLKLDDIITVRLFISSISKYIQLQSQIVRLRKIVANRFDIGLKFISTETYDGKYLLTLLSWKAEAIERAKK